jgi:[NiFe] hydrogenase diaphorase moiety small subunit
MNDKIKLTIDGREIEAERRQTILEAAEAAGVYIPRLCWMKDLTPFGSCRVCTVRVNGRAQSACTQPVAPGMIVENDTEEMQRHRRGLIDMLFVEGNHFCMFCEKSGACELQALAYRTPPTRRSSWTGTAACCAHAASARPGSWTGRTCSGSSGAGRTSGLP